MEFDTIVNLTGTPICAMPYIFPSDGLAEIDAKTGFVSNFPAPKEKTIYIVKEHIATALKLMYQTEFDIELGEKNTQQKYRTIEFKRKEIV